MEFKDLIAIVVLIFLEGALSMDNALVLATMVQHLPLGLRRRALTYGIVGAFTFRFISLFMLTWLVHLPWLKLAGGLYLVWLAIKHFMGDDDAAKGRGGVPCHFWRVVISIELTDIAFSADSILSAIGVSGKVWVLFVGACMGIVMMRIAASYFVKLLDRWPWLSHVAYVMVGSAGAKMCLTSNF